MPRPIGQPSSIGKRDSHDTRGSENPPTATQEVDNQKDTAGAHCRRQDRGGESSCPVMSRSPDRRSSLERGSPETKPRSCGSQPAHESLLNRRLRVLSPAVRTSESTSSATAEQIVASGPLKANMRAGCGKSRPIGRDIGYNPHCVTRCGGRPMRGWDARSEALLHHPLGHDPTKPGSESASTAPPFVRGAPSTSRSTQRKPHSRRPI